MRIALWGTGMMGTALSRRLGQCGHNLQVWNRSIDRAESLANEEAIRVFPTPVDAAANADMVLLTLSDASAIDSVLAMPGVLASLAGLVLVQMGTIAPEESRRLKAQLNEAGADYLEAPVLGSQPEALKGNLLIMAGGEQQVFERCLPLLRDCGPDPVLVGSTGRAAALKLAMNQLIGALTAGFALSLDMARQEGVPVEIFMKILRESALYAPTFDKKLNRMLSGDYSAPNFSLKHLAKDIELCRRTAMADNLDTGLLDALGKLLHRGVSSGYGEEDYSVLEALMAKK
ncbi:NAD(P)-dependent oxidoreductase [Acidihalobacter prosperus]